MKYRSCWVIFTLRSKFGSNGLIIWKYDTHSSNSRGDIRQNHWTMKYRSHRPTFILRSNVGSYWLIILKYYVHISNSLQDVMQNHWTIKYRSQWPIFILRSNFGSYWLIIHVSNSTKGTKLRTDERTNIQTERWKLYTPRYKCRGYKYMAICWITNTITLYNIPAHFIA